MATAKRNIQQLRRKLPWNYAQILSKRLDSYDVAQIKKVFCGQIKDEQIVGEILAEAIKLAKERKLEQKKTNRKIKSLLKK